MHYLVTFHKPNSDKLLTEQFTKLDTANRWASMVKTNGYIVTAVEPREGTVDV